MGGEAHREDVNPDPDHLLLPLFIRMFLLIGHSGTASLSGLFFTRADETILGNVFSRQFYELSMSFRGHERTIFFILSSENGGKKNYGRCHRLCETRKKKINAP